MWQTRSTASLKYSNPTTPNHLCSGISRDLQSSGESRYVCWSHLPWLGPQASSITNQSIMLVPTIKSSNIHLRFCSTPTYWFSFPSWPYFCFQGFQQQVHDRHLLSIIWDVCNLSDGEPSLCYGSVNPTAGGIKAKSDFVIRSKTTCWATCTRRSTRQWSATWSTASLQPTSPSSFLTRQGWPILWRRTPSTGNIRITGK